MPAILTIMCVSTENKRQKQKTKPTKQSRKVGKSKERTTKKLKKKKDGNITADGEEQMFCQGK